MNNVVGVASQIRTNTGAKLLRKISLDIMENSLIGLFIDRTNDDTSLRNCFNDDKMMEILKCGDCLSLNDERTIKFHQNWKQDSYVFDESRQIWYDSNINPITDDLFIPRDDNNG